MSALIIKSRATDEEIHRIDTTGKSADQIARVEEGMSINFNWEKYYWDEEK